MPGVIPFQTLSNADRPALGELAIALGAEFATPDAVALDAAVARIAAAPDWHLLDARDLDERSLAWQCAHEAASLLLRLLLERTRQLGLLVAELRAAELCLALPVEPDEHERLEHQLAVVRARLNWTALRQPAWERTAVGTVRGCPQDRGSLRAPLVRSDSSTPRSCACWARRSVASRRGSSRRSRGTADCSGAGCGLPAG
ncbi:MAG TPA: hypothetical protein VGO48_10270 [Conexibacter sp.]|jgi:hypothetical protein|nr:hypothetical protein [Conexibacter sp.]